MTEITYSFDLTRIVSVSSAGAEYDERWYTA